MTYTPLKYQQLLSGYSGPQVLANMESVSGAARHRTANPDKSPIATMNAGRPASRQVVTSGEPRPAATTGAATQHVSQTATRGASADDGLYTKLFGVAANQTPALVREESELYAKFSPTDEAPTLTREESELYTKFYTAP